MTSISARHIILTEINKRDREIEAGSQDVRDRKSGKRKEKGRNKWFKISLKSQDII